VGQRRWFNSKTPHVRFGALKSAMACQTPHFFEAIINTENPYLPPCGPAEQAAGKTRGDVYRCAFLC